MAEQWKDIAGFEGRYQISNRGRVKTLSFAQRYTHWRTGKELFRQTTERFLATQAINSGYLIAHLHLDNAQAIPMTDPATGERYSSISQAAKGARKSHRTVRTTFLRGASRV